LVVTITGYTGSLLVNSAFLLDESVDICAVKLVLNRYTVAVLQTLSRALRSRRPAHTPPPSLVRYTGSRDKLPVLDHFRKRKWSKTGSLSLLRVVLLDIKGGIRNVS